MAKKGLSLKERMKKKKEELKKRGGSGNVIFIKEGKLRVRVLPVAEDEDFVYEVTQFYLGPNIKGVFSPATFGEPCAIMEAYEELKASDDPDDKEIAKKFTPKKRYLMPVVVYSDTKGKTIDEDNSGKLVQLTNGLYQEIIDLYLDEDEWGDMTNPTSEGYDIYLMRSGTGMTDTEYSVQACKNTALPKKYAKAAPYDLEELVRGVIPTYEETKDKIEEYLSLSSGDSDEDEAPVKKKKKKVSKGKKEKTTSRSKKRKSSDI